VTDSQGVIQTIFFSRPVEIPVFINIQITRDTSSTSPWPSNGADLVRSALASFVDALEIGQDVIVFPQLISALNSIPGIIDIDLGIATTANPPIGTNANIPIAINQVAVIVDAANDIDVAVLP
jgi:hypothetical protein